MAGPDTAPEATDGAVADVPPPPTPDADALAATRARHPRRKPIGKLDDKTLFAHVEAHREEYVERLREFVAIESVSCDLARRGDVRRAVNWVKAWCKKLGGAVRLEELGGMVNPLPPVLLAQFGSDPWKKTVVVYGHLDVQPAKREDGWDTEPFDLVEKDGKLYGRGSTDDKGPVVCWLWALEAYRENNWELPVNIRFIFEGMEECGSTGFPELCNRLATPGEYLDPKAVDFVCVSDNYWSGKNRPCLSHGLRGIVYFKLEVQGSSKDLHSGAFGGCVHEALYDCMSIMTSMAAPDGRILIDGIYDDVPEMTERERETIREIDFDVEGFKEDAGVKNTSGKLIHDTKEELLAHRNRWPSLSIHGVQGAFDGEGVKTVIPAKVSGRFSLRLVPDMLPGKVEELVRAHVERKRQESGSPNLVELTLTGAGLPWLRDPDNDENYRAATAAVVRVHGVTPCLTREGGSIPSVQVLEEVTEASCVLVPVGCCDDGAHSQNEKLDVFNYLAGVKLFACYMEELASLPSDPDAEVKAAAALAAANRKAANKWRRECRVELLRYGCDCLECQEP